MKHPSNRGDRQHHEKRVYCRRRRDNPGYVNRYAGKTPGKLCSCEMCGNPRRYRGELTVQEQRRTD